MEISIVIVFLLFLLTCVFTVIFGYKAGYSKKIKEVKIDNQELLRERHELEREKSNLLSDIRKLKDEYNNNKKQLLKEANDNIESIKQEKMKTLKEQYGRKEDEYKRKFNDSYNATKQEYDNKIEALKKETEKCQIELEKMREAKAATIEAAKQDEIIQQSNDKFRLVLSTSESNDIKTLEGVRHLLSKPRILSMLIWQTYYQPKAKKLFTELLGSQSVTGIYKITNIKTQECYIGQAVNVKDRFNQHCKCGLGIDTPARNKLYEAMQKYGLDQFTFQLLEKCTAEDLNKREQYFINMYNSYNFGYNSNTGVTK